MRHKNKTESKKKITLLVLNGLASDTQNVFLWCNKKLRILYTLLIWFWLMVWLSLIQPGLQIQLGNQISCVTVGAAIRKISEPKSRLDSSLF